MSFYSQAFEDLLVEKKDFILWITLNRKESHNAYSIEMVENLVSVLRHADSDQNIRVMVITGAGKSFCAGGDIKAMREKSGMFAGDSNELREAYIKGIQEIPSTISKLKTPLMAMVNGPAIGAGCDLAAMCDLRISSEEAYFAETFVQVGLVPGDGGAYFLTRLIGYAKAMEMFFTCRKVSSSEAKEMGLVNQVTSLKDLRSETEKLCLHLVNLPPIALQMTKRALAHAYESTLSPHLELMASFQGITQRSMDHFEALDSLKENKEPTFKHR